VNQASSSVSTAVDNAATNLPISGNQPLGTSVYDTATVTGSPFVPTGTVTYNFYDTSTPVYGVTAPVTTQTVTLSGGVVPDSAPTGPLGAGSYAYIGVYSGDSNYTGFVGATEPLTVNQASSSVSTAIDNAATNLPISGNQPLGTSVYDTATVTGSPFVPTGTVTYNFYDTSTPVYGVTTPSTTQTVTLSGGLVPNSATTAALTAGSYAYIGVYSGDSNYSGSVGAVEPLSVVAKASPQITTCASPTNETVGGAALKDTADLTGGVSPTGTITFTLTSPSNTVVDTETVSVNGDHHYTTPTGYVPTQVGTYYWVASYSGDSNNQGVTSGIHDEPVVICKASPSIVTTPNPTYVTLATTSVTLKDLATLSGGYSETGSITFTLYLGKNKVDTETVTVSGNGTYTTPTGYTLPTSGTVTGTYQWDATYSGDSNNKSARDDDDCKEQVKVCPASPSLVTTPTPTIASQGTCTLLTDSAVLSGGYYPTGSITFTLYAPGCSSPVDTEKVTVDGDGTYSTPTGYTLPSNAKPGIYQWDATYSGDGNNKWASDNNDVAEQVVVVSPCCNLQNIAYSVYNPSTHTTTTPSDLSGNTQQGDTVTVTFTVPNGYYDQLSLVSYNAPESFYNANDANLQTVFSYVTQVEGPGTHTLSVTLPPNFYQVDFVCGTVITTLGPAGSNNFYHSQNRFIDGDNGGVNPVGSEVLQVQGTVFFDQNDNGIQDSGDSGKGGVTVKLTGTDLYGSAISQTATTNSLGQYTIAGMPFSNSAGYTVAVSVPSGDFAGVATAGQVNGTADGSATTSPEAIKTIVMGNSGQTSGAGYNFGIQQPVSISGQVYNDANGDGKLDNGETGLNGVTITLYNSSGTKVTSTTTSGSGSSAGSYSFTNLAPGTYSLVDTVLGAYVGTGGDVGSDGGTPVSSTDIGAIVLTSGESGSDYDFGQKKA